MLKLACNLSCVVTINEVKVKAENATSLIVNTIRLVEFPALSSLLL
jgi:hypothetical protein